MKKRFVLWGVALSLASIATAASFQLPVKYVNTDPNRWAKAIGVDPAEYKTTKKMAGQLSSDLRFGRPADEASVDHLVNVTKNGGAMAGEIYWILLPIRKKNYRAKFVEQATKSAQSTNESEAFAAMTLLKDWNDPRWKPLVNKYHWVHPELKPLALQPRWGQDY